MMTPRECLVELRSVVEAAPEERLHMRRLAERSACGTAMCALGWAVTNTRFREETSLVAFLMLPYYTYDAWDNIYDLFGLGQQDGDNLFAVELKSDAPPHGVTKAEVLWNIDRLLDGLPTRPYAATFCFEDPATCEGVEFAMNLKPTRVSRHSYAPGSRIAKFFLTDEKLAAKAAANTLEYVVDANGEVVGAR